MRPPQLRQELDTGQTCRMASESGDKTTMSSAKPGRTSTTAASSAKPAGGGVTTSSMVQGAGVKSSAEYRGRVAFFMKPEGGAVSSTKSEGHLLN